MHASIVFKQDMRLMIAIKKKKNDCIFTAKVYIILRCVRKYKDSSQTADLMKKNESNQSTQQF